MSIDRSIAEHYTHGALERTILDALRAAGKDPERLAPADLAPVDEFHIGGRQATVDFAGRFGARAGMTLLDIGSGLGGAARYFAEQHGCRVSGIDLTAEYVAVANALARRCGLGRAVDYRQGSALDLPFAPASFDGAYMLHVGMNIADKPRLFAAVRAALKPGAVFGIYDVMRTGPGELSFPVPWAARPETSFVAAPADYRRALEAAGFAASEPLSRRDFAIEFFRQMRARAAAGGPPPLGLHILMGGDFPQKTANMIANLEQGIIAPTEIFARAL
jgi:SAM-dependent methyltransferase